MKVDHLPILCIDLDGTLLDSDMLVEAGFSFLKQNPLRALSLLGWLKQGKARLKAHLAENSGVDVTVLPYNHRVLQLIDRARAEARRIVLATAAHRVIAESVAAHLGGGGG